MERQVSTATILVIVLVALAAVIGIGFAAFSIAKGSGNEGVQEMATQTDYASKSKFSEFNDKEVTGLMLKNFMDNNKGNHITFVIQTRTFRNPAKITSNRRIIMHNQAVYAIYGKIFEQEDTESYQLLNSKDEIPKWSRESYFLERRDGASLIYKGTYKVQDDFDYTAVHSNGSPEYIDDSASFLCNLIYDNGDNIVGIIAKQKNKPGSTTKESSVFAADKVLEHINKTDGGNIPLGGLVVWGESGGKQTLIREDGKAGQGFGEVGLSKDKVDTGMYDSIADNAIEEFVFEDLERTILIGYRGTSSQIKIPDSVTHVKSLTSDGSNPDAYNDNLKNVSAIVFNAGCIKIENLDLSLCPNIYSVYISPTTTVLNGVKLNQTQIEGPRHLKSQIMANLEGTVYIDDWDKKLYNCGCPSCQIAEDDWVYVWDGLDIVGYVGTLPKNLEIPLGCTGLGPHALAGGQFETITLPDSIQYVGEQAFYGCKNMIDIDLSSCLNITELGDNVFYQCTSLKSVKLPTSLEVIGNYCFSQCSSLKTVTGFENVRIVKDYAFYESPYLNSIDSMKSLEETGRYSFYGSRLLDCLSLDSITSLGVDCFGFQKNSSGGALEELIIPGNISEISNSAFYSCSIKVIKMEDGVKKLSPSCFSYMSGLTDIYIPASVTSISSTAFIGSPNVTLHFAEGSPFLADGGAIYNETFTVLIKGPTELGPEDTFVIRDTCKEIAANAFSGCSVGNITIPNSVTSIGAMAFSNAPNIVELRLTPNISSLGFIASSSAIKKLIIPANSKLSSYRFLCEKCHNITEIIIEGNNLHFKVVDGALYYDSKLIGLTRGVKNLVTPDFCTSILQYSLRGTDIETLDCNNCISIDTLGFAYASKLKSVELPNVEKLGARSFEGTSVTSVSLPKVKTMGYSFNGVNKYYGTFFSYGGSVVIGPSLESLSEYWFDNCSGNGQKDIDLSQCVLVKEIEGNCFKDFNRLTSLKLPPNLEIIREGAFSNFKMALEITIPESVDTIEAGAFVNCPKLSLKVPKHLKSQNNEDRWGIPNSRITWY